MTARVNQFLAGQSFYPLALSSLLGFAFFAGMGLPGLSAFISEVLVLLGAWQTHPLMTALGAATVLCGDDFFCVVGAVVDAGRARSAVR